VFSPKSGWKCFDFEAGQPVELVPARSNGSRPNHDQRAWHHHQLSATCIITIIIIFMITIRVIITKAIIAIIKLSNRGKLVWHLTTKLEARQTFRKTSRVELFSIF
jgi:hypothetical protein